MSSQIALELSPKTKIIEFVDLVKPLILYFDFKSWLTKLTFLSPSLRLDNVAVDEVILLIPTFVTILTNYNCGDNSSYIVILQMQIQHWN